MSWFWTIMFLSFTLGNINVAEARHLKKLPSAVVVGTVYCDTCFHQPFSKPTHFISGATVAVECKDNASSSNPNFRQEVKTNKQGEFQVHLPFHVSKHVKRIELCSVQLIRSNQPFCAVAATATSSTLSLKSRKHGTHIFSAGFFTFKPLNQPEVCDEKPIVENSINPDPISNPNNPAFPPPLQDPPISNPPALGGLIPLPPALGGLIPVPRLPPLLPRIPLFPPKEKKENALKQTEALDNKVSQPMIFPFPPPLLPPNPLLPPPSLFPPNPFQPPPSVIPPIFPSPPPSIFPPLLPTPPTPPFFGLPPIPGLTPSPPPPPPQIFPIPFPPFPFQPTPGFPGPGVPPAEASSGLKTNSP